MKSNIKIKIIEVILTWAEAAKNSISVEFADNGTTFSIPYDEFNFEGKKIASPILKSVLFDIKAIGGFEEWLTNPHRANELAQFVFRSVSVKHLTEYQKSLETNTQDKSSLSLPSYVAGELSFMGEVIEIKFNTNEDDLCKAIFRNIAAMKKLWVWDEMLEKWGDRNPIKENQMKVYRAGRRVNSKIAEETTINDLLIVKTKTITVNKLYLPQ